MKRFTKTLAATVIALSFVLPSASWAAGEYRSVNKSIKVGNDTTAGDVGSVNGSIRIGAGSLVRSVESVNGAIDISEDVKVERDVKAVNGSIGRGRGGDGGGDVETVNGAIELLATNVAGNIDTVNGGIRLLDGTVVEGNVRVREPQGWSSSRRKPVTVEIGEGVQVLGDLIFEHAVELRLHDSARVGEIIGDKVTVVER